MNKRKLIIKKLNSMRFKAYGDMISDGKLACMPICGMNWDTSYLYTNKSVDVVQQALDGKRKLIRLTYTGDSGDGVNAQFKYTDKDDLLTITKEYANLLTTHNIFEVELTEDDMQHIHIRIMLTGLFLGDTVVPCIITESRS